VSQSNFNITADVQHCTEHRPRGQQRSTRMMYKHNNVGVMGSALKTSAVIMVCKQMLYACASIYSVLMSCWLLDGK